MAVSLAETALDAILTLQLAIAWAGEGRCDPPRLGWWQTDLTDPDGGGDLLRRLLPRTHAWAGLEAVREAARRTDARLRTSLAHPDQLRTINFLGFEVDERIPNAMRSRTRASDASTRTCGCWSALPTLDAGRTPAFVGSIEPMLETLISTIPWVLEPRE